MRDVWTRLKIPSPDAFGVTTESKTHPRHTLRGLTPLPFILRMLRKGPEQKGPEQDTLAPPHLRQELASEAERASAMRSKWTRMMTSATLESDAARRPKEVFGV